MAEVQVNYCWRCGKRSGPDQKTCYYCSAPLNRQIEDPHQCPYCFSDIHPKAIKCPKCGEFVDGRDLEKKEEPKPQQPQDPNLIFVIPPQLSGTGQPMFIPAGQPLSASLIDKLSPDTQRAIEAGKPEAIDVPEVLALPAQEAIKMEPKALLPDGRTLEEYSEALALPAAQQPPADSDNMIIDVPAKSEESVPAEAAKATGNLLVRGGILAGKGLMKAAAAIPGIIKFIFNNAPDPNKVSARAVEEQEPEKHRICDLCNTQILRTDPYCFHCGHSYVEQKKRKRIPKKIVNNSGFYVVTVLMFALVFALKFLKSQGIEAPEIVEFSLPVAAVLASFIAFFRQIGLASICWLLISIAGAAAAYLYVLT